MSTVSVRERRDVLAGVAVLVAVLALGGAGYARFGGSSGHRSPTRTAPTHLGTAEVVTTDLSDYWTETGTLGYRKGRTLRGVADGQVTWLPKSGHSVVRGQALFRVDDRPVSLFYGTTPLFRELGAVGTIGRDVRVVADNLAALGYRVGPQPAPGTHVMVPGAEPEPEADASRSAVKSPDASAPTPSPSAAGT